MRKLLTALLVCTAATSCNSSSTTDGRGVRDDGTMAHPGVESLHLNWSAKDLTFGSAFLSNNLLFSGKTIRAMNLDTHKIAFDLGDKVDMFANNYVQFGENVIVRTSDDAHNEYLKVVSPQGKILNTILIPGDPRSAGDTPPILTANALYVGSGPGLYKYNRADLMNPDAKPVWVRKYPKFTLAAYYASDDDHVFVAPNDNSNVVIALDGNGQERWTAQVNTPEIAVGQTYIMQPYKNTLILQVGVEGLLAIDQTTGKTVWGPNSIDLCPDKGTTANNVTISGNRILVGPDAGSCILSFNADTGKNNWVFKSPNRVTFMTLPLYHNGVVYANNGLLFAVDADSGKLIGESDQFLGENGNEAVVYDPRHDEIVTWGNRGLFAYKPLK